MTNAIAFNGVSFSYGKHPVLHDVNFTIPSQSISVLFGPSGSGKTTCLRLTAGLETPRSGNIHLFDSDAISLQPNQREVGYCFQEPALWNAVTVHDHLRLCMKTDSANQEDIQNLLNDYHLQHVVNHYPNQLSGGEKKRLDFARAVASQPKILLLDEPLSSVEEPMRDELIQTIERCKANGGSIVAVTHQKDELFTMAEHIVILQHGRVMNEGSPEDVFHKPKNKTTAKLMGINNNFNVSINNGIMQTPFGAMNYEGDQNGEWLAGCPVNHFEIIEKEDANAVVKSCIFSSGIYRIKFMIHNQVMSVMNESPIQPGKKIDVKLKQIPVLIEPVSHE